HGGRGYGSKNSSSWMLPGPPKTCTATSCGDAMNWTRRWIATAVAAGLTTWFAALAAPAASAAPPAVAPTITTDFTSPFTPPLPRRDGHGRPCRAGCAPRHRLRRRDLPPGRSPDRNGDVPPRCPRRGDPGRTLHDDLQRAGQSAGTAVHRRRALQRRRHGGGR